VRGIGHIMTVANVMIYGGVAGLIALFAGAWWGGIAACAALLLVGIQLALKGER